jgi:putative nucleotidyltransferase with HDIG domain
MSGLGRPQAVPVDVVALSDALDRVSVERPAAIQVMTAIDDPNAAAPKVAAAVETDPAFAAQVMRLANSAFYGHARRVTTISDASLLLGFSTIKSLAISTHTSRLLAGSLPGYGLQRGELWHHSVAVAFTGRRLALEARVEPVEEAFVAGLLHDIGKLILSSRMEDAFDEVVALAEERRVPLHEVEVELLGFDHAELGAHIAAAWSFPPELEEAIRFHHSPSGATIKPALSHCVHLADAACMMLGVGLGADGLMYGMDPHSLEVLGITPERLMHLMDDVGPLISSDPFGGA